MSNMNPQTPATSRDGYWEEITSEALAEMRIRYAYALSMCPDQRGSQQLEHLKSASAALSHEELLRMLETTVGIAVDLAHQWARQEGSGAAGYETIRVSRRP